MSDFKIGIQNRLTSTAIDTWEEGESNLTLQICENDYAVWHFFVLVSDENNREVPGLVASDFNIDFLKFSLAGVLWEASSESLDPTFRPNNRKYPTRIIPFSKTLWAITVWQLMSQSKHGQNGFGTVSTFPADWLEITINSSKGSGFALYYLH